MWCEGICVVCTWQPPLLSLRLFSLVWPSAWAEEPSCMLEAQLLWCPPALAESTGHTCWQLDLLVWSCVCVHEYMDVCIHGVHLATVSRSSLVEIDVFALFMRLYELWDYLSHSHHHTLSLRGLHSCKHPHQRYIITLAKKLLYLSSDSSPSRIMHANIPNNAHRSYICNSNHAQRVESGPCVRARAASACAWPRLRDRVYVLYRLSERMFHWYCTPPASREYLCDCSTAEGRCYDSDIWKRLTFNI